MHAKEVTVDCSPAGLVLCAATKKVHLIFSVKENFEGRPLAHRLEGVPRQAGGGRAEGEGGRHGEENLMSNDLQVMPDLGRVDVLHFNGRWNLKLIHSFDCSVDRDTSTVLSNSNHTAKR